VLTPVKNKRYTKNTCTLLNAVRHNPLISPIADRQWEARGTFNPTVIKKGNITHLLYRALGRPDALMTPAGISTIGKALSLDGERFQNRRQFIIPTEDGISTAARTRAQRLF
jgi:predicted GH43/DUF377 family glycosyl hydrolase